MDKLFDKYTVFGRFITITVWIIGLVLVLIVPHLIITWLGALLIPISIASTALIPIIYYVIKGKSDDASLIFMLTIFFWVTFALFGLVLFDFVNIIYQTIVNMLSADGWLCTVGCKG